MTAANTATFAHSTGRRLGTAENVERIIPVEYSPVITSTPSTPIESCAMPTPGEVDPQPVQEEAELVLRAQIRPARLEDRAGQDADADDQEQGDEQRPARGAQ